MTDNLLIVSNLKQPLLFSLCFLFFLFATQKSVCVCVGWGGECGRHGLPSPPGPNFAITKICVAICLAEVGTRMVMMIKWTEGEIRPNDIRSLF